MAVPVSVLLLQHEQQYNLLPLQQHLLRAIVPESASLVMQRLCSAVFCASMTLLCLHSCYAAASPEALAVIVDKPSFSSALILQSAETTAISPSPSPEAEAHLTIKQRLGRRLIKQKPEVLLARQEPSDGPSSIGSVWLSIQDSTRTVTVTTASIGSPCGAAFMTRSVCATPTAMCAPAGQGKSTCRENQELAAPTPTEISTISQQTGTDLWLSSDASRTIFITTAAMSSRCGAQYGTRTVCPDPDGYCTRVAGQGYSTCSQSTAPSPSAPPESTIATLSEQTGASVWLSSDASRTVTITTASPNDRCGAAFGTRTVCPDSYGCSTVSDEGYSTCASASSGSETSPSNAPPGSDQPQTGVWASTAPSTTILITTATSNGQCGAAFGTRTVCPGPNGRCTSASGRGMSTCTTSEGSSPSTSVTSSVQSSPVLIATTSVPAVTGGISLSTPQSTTPPIPTTPSSTNSTASSSVPTSLSSSSAASSRSSSSQSQSSPVPSSKTSIITSSLSIIRSSTVQSGSSSTPSTSITASSSASTAASVASSVTKSSSTPLTSATTRSTTTSSSLSTAPSSSSSLAPTSSTASASGSGSPTTNSSASGTRSSTAVSSSVTSALSSLASAISTTIAPTSSNPSSSNPSSSSQVSSASLPVQSITRPALDIRNSFLVGGAVGTLPRLEALPGRQYMGINGTQVVDAMEFAAGAGMNIVRVQTSMQMCTGPTVSFNNSPGWPEREKNYALDWGCIDLQVGIAKRAQNLSMRIVHSINMGQILPPAWYNLTYVQTLQQIAIEVQRQVQPFLDANILPDIFILGTEETDGMLYRQIDPVSGAIVNERGVPRSTKSAAVLQSELCGQVPTGNLASWPQLAGYYKHMVATVKNLILQSNRDPSTVLFGLHSHGQYFPFKNDIVYNNVRSEQKMDNNHANCDLKDVIPADLYNQTCASVLDIMGWSGYPDPMHPADLNGTGLATSLTNINKNLAASKGVAEKFGRNQNGRYTKVALILETASQYDYPAGITDQNTFINIFFARLLTEEYVLGALWWEPMYGRTYWEGGKAALYYSISSTTLVAKQTALTFYAYAKSQRW